MISDDFAVQAAAIFAAKVVVQLLQTCTTAYWTGSGHESYIDVVSAKFSYNRVPCRFCFDPLRLSSTLCSAEVCFAPARRFGMAAVLPYQSYVHKGRKGTFDRDW